jgi:hypothetical protein
MRPCSVNEFHKVTPIYWEKGIKTISAKSFMCEHCLRIFTFEEISNRHFSLAEKEKKDGI